MKKQIGTLLLALLLPLTSNPRAAVAQQNNRIVLQSSQQPSFILPEENRTCVSDYEDYKGFAYGPFHLGMSFKKWKQVQEEMGFFNAIQKVSRGNDKTAASYKMSKPPMDMWGHPWSPVFLFFDDQGRYRLTMITGEFLKSDASGLLGQLSAEYGEPENDPNTGSLVWSSEDAATRILALVNKDGTLGVNIYDRALFSQWKSQIFGREIDGNIHEH